MATVAAGVDSPYGYDQALSSPLVFICAAAAPCTWPKRETDRSLKPR